MTRYFHPRDLAWFAFLIAALTVLAWSDDQALKRCAEARSVR